jgi:VanZ family protein
MTGPFLQKISQNRWIALAWTAVIFLLMIIPGSKIPHQGLFGIPHLDKFVHLVIFGLFVWFWFHASTRTGKKDPGKILTTVFLIAVGYGTAMEFVQYFFTDRDFDIRDILADAAGAAIAWAWIGRGIKKVSPYGNRGRNQN